MLHVKYQDYISKRSQNLVRTKSTILDRILRVTNQSGRVDHLWYVMLGKVIKIFVKLEYVIKDNLDRGVVMDVP